MIILVIVGSLAAVYAAVGFVMMISKFLTSDPSNAYGAANMAASVVPPVIGLLVAVICFKSAFAKPKSNEPPDGEEMDGRK
jgi:uncharacterized membrane protein